MNEESCSVSRARPDFKLSKEEGERFWSKVDKSGGIDSCWEWTGGKALGYGIYRISANGRRQVKSHRVAYVLAVGPIPYYPTYHGMCICHKCDNPGCCNPSHLFLGTNVDNMTDMVKKGRSLSGDKNPSRSKPETRPRGDNHYSRTNPESVRRGVDNTAAKLTEDQVLEIRKLRSEGKIYKDISPMFNVSTELVALICLRKLWKHI